MTSHQDSKIRRPPSPALLAQLARNSHSDTSGDTPAPSERGNDSVSVDVSVVKTLVNKEKEVKILPPEVRKLKYKSSVKVYGRAYKHTRKESKHLRSKKASVLLTNGKSNLDMNNTGGKNKNVSSTQLQASMASNNLDESKNSENESDDESDCSEQNSNVGSDAQQMIQQQSLCGSERHESSDDDAKGNEIKENDLMKDDHLKCKKDGEGCCSHNKGDLEKEDREAKRTDNGQRKLKHEETQGLVKSKTEISDLEMQSYECISSREGDFVQETSGLFKDTEYEKLSVSIAVDTRELGWDNKDNENIRKDNALLKHEVEKIVKVNNEWHIFWTKQKAVFDKTLAEKDAVIAKLEKNEEQIKELINAEITDKERYQKEKDEILLLTKQRVEKLEGVIEQLRGELSQDRQKCERAQKLSRTLLQQKKDLELEVKRLNAILETKVEEQKSLKLHTISHGLSSLSGDPQRNDENASSTLSRQRASGDRKRESENGYQSGTKEPSQHQQQQGKTANDEQSLTKEELKERLMLLKEQKKLYEMDFKEERRDRENLVGQLEDTKQKLDQTKGKLEEKRYKTHVYSRYQQRPVLTTSRKSKTEEQTHGYLPGKYYYPEEQRNHFVPCAVPGHQTNHHHNVPQNRHKEPVCICPRNNLNVL